MSFELRLTDVGNLPPLRRYLPQLLASLLLLTPKEWPDILPTPSLWLTVAVFTWSNHIIVAFIVLALKPNTVFTTLSFVPSSPRYLLVVLR